MSPCLLLQEPPPSHHHVVVVLVVVAVLNVDVVVVVVVVVVVIVVIVVVVVDVVGGAHDGVDDGEDEAEVAKGGHLAAGLAGLFGAVGKEHDRVLLAGFEKNIIDFIFYSRGLNLWSLK